MYHLHTFVDWHYHTLFGTIHLVRVIQKYFSEVKLELSKVVWPKKQEVVRLTLVVLSISAIVGIYLGGIDYLFTKLLESLIVM